MCIYSYQNQVLSKSDYVDEIGEYIDGVGGLGVEYAGGCSIINLL